MRERQTCVRTAREQSPTYQRHPVLVLLLACKCKSISRQVDEVREAAKVVEVDCLRDARLVCRACGGVEGDGVDERRLADVGAARKRKLRKCLL